MLPSHPVVLASEAGPEYFASNHDLQNPHVLNHVRIIDNIVRSGGVRQMQEGGATEPLTNDSPPIPVQDLAVNTDIKEVLENLTAILEAGLYAVLEDETLIKSRRRLARLDEAAGGLREIKT